MRIKERLVRGRVFLEAQCFTGVHKDLNEECTVCVSGCRVCVRECAERVFVLQEDRSRSAAHVTMWNVSAETTHSAMGQKSHCVSFCFPEALNSVGLFVSSIRLKEHFTMFSL